MRLLLLALITPSAKHLLDKFNAQFLALREQNPDTHCTVLSRATVKDSTAHAFRYLGSMSREQQMQAAANIAHALQPDIIYFRYPYFDELCHKFILLCPNTVFEHHSMAWTEISEEQQREEGYWGPKILRACAGVVGVTDEIRQYEQNRAGRDIPGLTLSNGIACRDTPLSVRPAFTEELHIALAARFSFWHGLDRLLEGLAAFSGKNKVRLHIAGSWGEEKGHGEACYRALIARLHLEPQILFHGFLGPEKLRELFSRCHMACGTLSVSRKHLSESASLKHRAYTFEGIPFFYGGADSDFPPDLPFARRLPDDESPIDMERVWNFACECSALPDLAESMRAYAVQVLSWDAKARTLLDFLRPLAAGRTPAQRPDSSPLFSCIVLCGNDIERTKACVDALLQQGHDSLEIILAHAYERENTVLDEVATRYGQSVPIVAVKAQGSQKRLLRKAGAAAASGRWLWALPDNFRPAPGFLNDAARAAAEHPEADLISGRIVWRDKGDGSVFAPCSSMPRFWRRHFLARALLVRRTAWEAVYEQEPDAQWRRGDKRFNRKCRRSGLIPILLDRSMIVRFAEHPAKRLLCRAALTLHPDI